MKLKHKIEISLTEFFKTGKFDCLKLDKTKEWVINNFPDPDCFDSDFMTEEVNVWTYGGIELHFQKNQLYCIFSDHWYEGKLDDSSQLKLHKWIFDDINKLKFLYVLEKLNEHNIGYKKKTDKLGVLLRLTSGVELTFDTISDEHNLSENDFHLTSFALVAENGYRCKE